MKLPVEESEWIYCDVQDVVRYLNRRSPDAARRFLEAFKATVALLSDNPCLGRVRIDLGAPETRSWRIGTFRHLLLFYEVHPDRVRLLRVLHGYRDLRAALEG